MSLMYLLPMVEYQTSNTKVVMSDLSRRVGLFEQLKSNPRFYVEYTVQDGETAESIADRYYDNVDYDFLIYLMNEMYNPLEDWPMSYSDLLSYARSKYDDVNTVHHYLSIASGEIVDSQWPTYDLLPVTNIEHELKVNDERSEIILLTPEHATNAYRQMKALLKGV